MRLRFGVSIPQEGLSYNELKRNFKDLEGFGFYSAFVYDHFMPQWSREDAPILENWTLLSSLASETSSIRIGAMVNCNSYRYPSLLAKMSASLDVISSGRLEFMIGAGAYEAEYHGYGIPFESNSIRVERMWEAIRIIKLMWTEHKAYFRGKYYNISEAICYPKPAQKPRPLVWVGGGGEKITLKATVRVGDGTNFFGSPEVFERKLKRLREYCEQFGRKYGAIKKSWAGDLAIGATQDDVKLESRMLEDRFRRLVGSQIDEQMTSGLKELEKSRLMGTPSQIIKRIEEYAELGVDYFIVIPADLRDMKNVELFINEVAPSFS